MPKPKPDQAYSYLAIRVSPELRSQIKQLAKAQERSESAFCRLVLRRALEATINRDKP
jgi:predicted transcriptional regulator